jgi:ADP-ribose pyrophosphatase YjhB (NUDIX family)
MTARIAAARTLLHAHRAADAIERVAVRDTLDLLDRAADPFARSTFPGHLTGSAVVLDESRQHVLLIWHAALERYLQPGGHCERDDTAVVFTAMREVEEETGVSLRGAEAAPLAHVDVHAIPARGHEPAHQHHDLRFAFVIPRAATSMMPASGGTSGWVPVAALAAFGADVSLRRAVERALVVERASGHASARGAN